MSLKFKFYVLVVVVVAVRRPPPPCPRYPVKNTELNTRFIYLVLESRVQFNRSTLCTLYEALNKYAQKLN